MRPDCVVFDEPTAMLDPRGRESIIKIMRDLRDYHGVTIVLITHHMDEAADADRLIVMSDGDILMDGTPREVFLDIDTLRETGLDIPETALLLHELKNDGFDLRLDALSVDDCAETIYAAITNYKDEGFNAAH